MKRTTAWALTLGLACLLTSACGTTMAMCADAEPGPLETYDCGTISLYQLCKLEGLARDITVVEKALPPPKPAGYSLLDLRDAARKLGLPLDGAYLKPGTRSPDRPLLVFKKTGQHGHFLIVRPVGHTGKLVQVLDGVNSPEVLDATELYSSTEWTGLGLAPQRPVSLGIIGAGLAIAVALMLIRLVPTRSHRKPQADY